MKKSILASALLLTACSNPSSMMQSLEERLENPLYEERYAEELVELIVQMNINQDPLLEDEKINKEADEARRTWLSRARDARALQREGVVGHFAVVSGYVQGQALLLNNMLYLGPGFVADPGVDMQIYLGTYVDPRDVSDFPHDENSVHIGRLESAYGAQRYAIPPHEGDTSYRTVTIWDAGLQRIQGFAQLN